MIKEIHDYYKQRVLAVTDSWFGNNGLWSKLDCGREGKFHLLSRIRTNLTLYDIPQTLWKNVRQVALESMVIDRVLQPNVQQTGNGTGEPVPCSCIVKKEKCRHIHKSLC